MFEPRHEPLISRTRFVVRMVRSIGVALAVVALSLGMGACGYHVFGGLPWLDALLNASMILTGMGPVDPMRTAGAKLFATAYALFSGVVFLSMAGILVAPLFHRFLHRFHLEASRDKGGKKAP